MFLGLSCWLLRSTCVLVGLVLSVGVVEARVPYAREVILAQPEQEELFCENRTTATEIFSIWRFDGREASLDFIDRSCRMAVPVEIYVIVAQVCTDQGEPLYQYLVKLFSGAVGYMVSNQLPTNQLLNPYFTIQCAVPGIVQEIALASGYFFRIQFETNPWWRRMFLPGVRR